MCQKHSISSLFNHQKNLTKQGTKYYYIDGVIILSIYLLPIIINALVKYLVTQRN